MEENQDIEDVVVAQQRIDVVWAVVESWRAAVEVEREERHVAVARGLAGRFSRQQDPSAEALGRWLKKVAGLTLAIL